MTCSYNVFNSFLPAFMTLPGSPGSPKRGGHVRLCDTVHES